jgi:hypothetical protein
MIKTERKCNAISQLSNENQLYIKTYKDGTVEKRFDGGKLQYLSDNHNSNELFNREVFYEKCVTLNWEDDLFSLIKQSEFGSDKILSFSVLINQERCQQHFELDNVCLNNDMLSTFVEMRLILKANNSLINVKRNLFNNALLDKNALLGLLGNEINKVYSQYSSFFTTDLISVNPDEYEIILPAGIGGIYTHEALGHALEADLYFKEDSVLSGKLGHRITTNSSISISDTCNNGDLIYYAISDDGSAPRSINLIEKGYLSNVMTDEFTASIYGVDNTGNGRAFDCFNYPLPRMRNTYIHNGNQAPHKIVRNTHKGIIATEILGGNVIMQTGNFVFNVAHGMLVEDGEIIGISAPFLFTGNIIQSLDSINALGDDLSFTFATCGKGGQLINVSYGQPTIRIAKRKAR